MVAVVKSWFKSDTFKLLLVVCGTLGVQIVGAVHWSDIMTPNWVGATLLHFVKDVLNAFGITLSVRAITQRGNTPTPEEL